MIRLEIPEEHEMALRGLDRMSKVARVAGANTGSLYDKMRMAELASTLERMRRSLLRLIFEYQEARQMGESIIQDSQ